LLSDLKLTPISKIPRSQPIDTLLEKFQKTHKHIAVIVDEYGKSTSINKNLGTIMLQENYQEIDWNIGWHNGGVWLPDRTVRKN
jgi:hypothetical protein